MGEMCCLLQICCDRAQRQQKLIAHYESIGLDRTYAERCADDAIARVDRFLETWIGKILKQLVAHAHETEKP